MSGTRAAMATDKCPVVGDTVSSKDQRTLRFSWETRATETPFVSFPPPRSLYVRRSPPRGPSAGYRRGLGWTHTPSTSQGAPPVRGPAPREGQAGLVSNPRWDIPQLPGAASRSVLLETETEKEMGFPPVTGFPWLPR